MKITIRHQICTFLSRHTIYNLQIFNKLTKNVIKQSELNYEQYINGNFNTLSNLININKILDIYEVLGITIITQKLFDWVMHILDLVSDKQVIKYLFSIIKLFII